MPEASQQCRAQRNDGQKGNDGDTAKAWSRWLWVVEGSDAKPRVERGGHYVDTLVRENGQWKFKSRQAVTEINK